MYSSCVARSCCSHGFSADPPAHVRLRGEADVDVDAFIHRAHGEDRAAALSPLDHLPLAANRV
eukprot:3202718-Pleurochrysis_carterae.AAC.1